MEQGTVFLRAKQFQEEQRVQTHEGYKPDFTPSWGWLGESITPEHSLFLKNEGLEILTQMCGAPRPENSKDKTRNQDHMSDFLDNNVKWGLPSLEGVDFTKVIPNGFSLLDALNAEMARNSDHGYKLPPVSLVKTMMDNRSIELPNNITSASVEVKEIDLVRSSSEERREFIQWMTKFHMANQREYPSGMLSVDVEGFVVPNHALEELKDAVCSLNSKEVSAVLTSYGAKSTTAIPARIIVGDGIHWFGSIRFPWNDNPKYISKSILMDSTPLKADNELLIHLFSYPWVGQGIQNDRNVLMDFFFNIYGVQVKMPKVVELDAIAITAGWKLEYSNMFVMNLVTCGGILNKLVSRADNLWYKPYDNLPSSLQAYLIGDVRCGYICHVVLSSLLIRDLFPDIDVVCSSLELLPDQWVGYFNTILVNVLSEKSIYQEAKKQAKTRQEMILSLREYNNEVTSRVMRKEIDPRLEIFAKMVPVWPTVPYGGARSLHQVVHWFSKVQYKTLKELAVPHSRFVPVLDKKADLPLLEYIQCFIKMVFGRTNEHVEIFSKQQRTLKPGLVADELYEGKKFEIPIHDLTLETLKVSAKAAGTGIANGILETCRLYPYMIPCLLGSIEKIELTSPAATFWQRKCGLYDRIRQMYRNLYSTEAPTVKFMENFIRKKRVRVLNVELTCHQNKNRIERQTVLSAMARRADETGSGRSNLQKRAYQIIPRTNSDNARKRARNQEKKENNKVPDKRRKGANQVNFQNRAESEVTLILHNDEDIEVWDRDSISSTPGGNISPRNGRSRVRSPPLSNHTVRFLSPSVPRENRISGPRYRSTNFFPSPQRFPRRCTPPGRSDSCDNTKTSRENEGKISETRTIRLLPDPPQPTREWENSSSLKYHTDKEDRATTGWDREYTSSQSKASSSIYSRLDTRHTTGWEDRSNLEQYLEKDQESPTDWDRGYSSAQSVVLSHIYSRLGPRHHQPTTYRSYSPPRDWSHYIGTQDTPRVQRRPVSYEVGNKRSKRNDPHPSPNNTRDAEDEFVAVAVKSATLPKEATSRRWK